MPISETAIQPSHTTWLDEPIPALAGRRRAVGWIIGIVILAVYLLGISAEWTVGLDSGLYLNLARNLSRGQGYTLAGMPSAFVPPGFPAFLAGMMLCGAGSFLAMNVAMCLMALATIYLTYLLLCQFIHRDWAMLMTAAMALTREIAGRSGQILSDIPFMLLVVAALLLYAQGLRKDNPRRWGWEIASILLVASCWVRIVGFPLAGGAGLAVLIESWRRARARAILSVAILAIGMAATLAFFYTSYSHNDPDTGSYASFSDHAANVSFLDKWVFSLGKRFDDASGQLCRLLLGQGKGASPAADRHPIQDGFVSAVTISLLVVPILIGMVNHLRRKGWLGPLVLVCYLGSLLMATGILRTRYMQPMAPFLILYLVWGYLWIAQKLQTTVNPLTHNPVNSQRPTSDPAARSQAHEFTGSRVHDLVGRSLAAGLLGLMVCINLPPIVVEICEKHGGDYALAQDHGQWKDTHLAAEFLKKHPPVNSCVLGEQPLGYLADVPCPSLSSKIRFGSLSDARIDEILRKFRVSYIVLETPGRKKEAPFFDSMSRYLGDAKPVFTSDKLNIYENPTKP